MCWREHHCVAIELKHVNGFHPCMRQLWQHTTVRRSLSVAWGPQLSGVCIRAAWVLQVYLRGLGCMHVGVLYSLPGRAVT